MSTLFIGHCDQGKTPIDREQYLRTYHNVDGVLKGRISFREDDRTKWRRFREIGGHQVRDLQQFLLDAGFMPKSERNGVFGYATQASVRLFQEYVRTIEGFANVKPDGYVGSGTREHIERWKRNALSCRWGGGNTLGSEYNKWIAILKKAKQHYLQHPNSVLNQVSQFNKSSDSLPIRNWKFNTTDIHLIGIRLGEDIGVFRRSNNDLFILLINGKVFKFWGSTDPNQSIGSRIDEPFLVEGQHKYKFGWHKISNEQKVYRALRPFQHGVLVFRDKNNDNALDKDDIVRGLDPHPNPVINIHWSGKGNSNFSAGCQVIAGESYMNDTGDVISCSAFAASSYSDLSDSRKKTKAAYNVFTDLVLSYAPKNVDYLYYTLGRDESLNIDNSFGQNGAGDMVERLKS